MYNIYICTIIPGLNSTLFMNYIHPIQYMFTVQMVQINIWPTKNISETQFLAVSHPSRTKPGLLFNDDVHQLWQGSSGVVLVGLSGSSTHLRSQISSGIEAKSLQKNVISSSENHIKTHPNAYLFLWNPWNRMFFHERFHFFFGSLGKTWKGFHLCAWGRSKSTPKGAFLSTKSWQKGDPKKLEGTFSWHDGIRWRGYHGYIRGDP